MKTKKSPFLPFILNFLAPDAPRPQGRSTSVLGGMAALLFLATAPGAFAVTWTGTTSGDWADGSNWGGTAPVAGDPLTFAGTTNPSTNNTIAADTSFGAISFTNTVNGQSFTLAGNSVTLGGNITTTATGGTTDTITDIISLDTILSATRTITLNARHNLTISGNISESSAGFGITKQGVATLNLTGANSFSGPVNVNGGFLTVNSIADTGTSALGTGALTLTAGQFTFLGDSGSNTSTSRAITLAGGITINTAPTGASAAASTLTLAGTFTTNTGGAKSITFAGGNTGANTVSSLLANATDGSVLTVTKNGGGNWELTNPNNSFTGAFNLNQGTLTVSSIKDSGVPSNIGQGVSIRMGNAASTGTMRYTGGAQSINRAVQLGNNSATPASGDTGGGTIQNEGSGALVFSGLPAFNTPLSNSTGVGANRVLTLRGTNADANTISGAIQDNIVTAPATGTATVGVTKADAGNWTIAGANTYSGATIVSGGTLNVSGSRNVSAGAMTVGIAASTAPTAVLNLQNTGSYSTGAMTIANGTSAAAINQSAGTITSVGGAGLIMGNGSTPTNATYALSGGSLTVANIIMGSNGATPTPHVTNINLSGAGTLTTTTLRIGRYDVTNSLALNTDNTFSQTGGTATVTNLGLGGNAVDVASVIPIIANLNLTGGTFSATNFASLSAGGTNTSTITIGGTAQVTLPAFPTVRGTASTATLTFDGGTLIPAAASTTYLSDLTNAFITANGAKIDVPATKDITIAQVLENAPSAVGSLTKSGVGTLVLSGANTYTGNTTVVDGTLEISSTYLADSSTLTIGTVAASPAVLNLPNAGTDIVAALVIDGVAQSSGLYTSTNSGGAITGQGKIQVGGASNTYANWLTANAPATGFTTDTDNDGVPNGVENVLGTNPNTSSAGLTQVSATASSVTFQHTLNPTIASDVSYTYQWSSDLIEWKASTMPNTAGTIGTIVPSAPVAGVVTVVTTRTGTTSSKLFTRIQASNP